MDEGEPGEGRARWALVLAGGDGTRLTAYVERRFGDRRPKQYCAFSGTRTMLQHTLDRAGQLSGAERTITVIAAWHDRWARAQLAAHRGTVVEQPIDRGTGPGVFLALAWVRARDPSAVVYLLPSDHYVRPRDRFVAALRAVGDAAALHADRLVLAAVRPEGPEPEYGYIQPSPGSAGPWQRVLHFVEKPSSQVAAQAIAGGALWNTMVLASTVEALWQAGRATVPAMIDRFDELLEAIDTPFERAAIHDAYLDMPRADFSRDVLERVTDRCLVGRLDDVEWSDWGGAERVEATLARLL